MSVIRSFIAPLNPAHVLRAVALVCAAMFAYGLYLQHVEGLDPCPMCIVQRYALVLVGLWAAVWGWVRPLHTSTWGLRFGGAGLATIAGFGAFTAARQSWLQWYPPEVLSCGRDLYGMIESFPLRRVIPMVFSGRGDCSKIDWTFLGLTIANWSFLVFSAMLLVGVWLLVRRATHPAAQDAP
jgi:disulfide bond formation protein DsbB